MHNKIFLKKQINTDLNKLLDEIDLLLNNSCHNIFSFGKCDFNSAIKYYLSKTATQTTEELLKIIVDIGSKSEMHGPGSFKLFLRALVTLRKLQDVSPGVIQSKIDNLSNEFCLANMHFADKTTILELLELTNIEEKTKILIKEIYEVAGGSSKIILEKSKHNSIEVINGFNFELENLFSIQKWRNSNVRILLIDGMVDSVSEIDHIMSYFAKTKEPLLIFARGFHDEVILTLRTNFNRATLNVIPIKVEYDVDGANTLKDLAVICGTDVISSLKGNVISLIKPEEIIYIKSVDISDRVVTLVENKNLQEIKVNLAMILEKKSKEQVFGAEEIYNKRIKTLTPNCVVVRLTDFKTLEEIDLINRMFKSALQFGLVEKFKFEYDFVFYEQNLFPIATIYFPIKFALEAYNNFSKIGCVITNSF